MEIWTHEPPKENKQTYQPYQPPKKKQPSEMARLIKFYLLVFFFTFILWELFK
jgi:hypothetical protein